MSRFRSTALAATCALAVMGFSGQLASVSAEPVDLPAAKVYAGTTDLGGPLALTPAQAAAALKKSIWGDVVIPGGFAGCNDMRCHTGFYGYSE
jgi:hypothetical protein